MRSAILLAVAVVGLPLAARAETATFPLKNLTPAALAGILADEKTLLLPDGIETVTLDLKKKAVSFSGSSESLEQVGILLKLLDVAAPTVSFSLKLVRDGKTVATPTIKVVSNKSAALQSPGLYNFELKPHVNGDGTVSLQLETATEKGLKRLTPGKPESYIFKYTTAIVTATIEKPAAPK